MQREKSLSLVLLRGKQTGAGPKEKTKVSVWNREDQKPKEEGDKKTRTVNQ